MGKSKIAIINFLISAALAVAVALVGLLIENWFPKILNGKFWPYGVLSLIAVSLILAFAWWLISLRKTTLRERGTLYYLRLLPSGLKVFHQEMLQRYQQRTGISEVRTVVRGVPPLDKEWVVDVSEVVHEFNSELHRILNHDSLDTGYHFAPDLQFPLALAVGYDLVVWSGFTLLESIPVTKQAHATPKEQVLEWGVRDRGQLSQQVGARTRGESNTGGRHLIDVHVTWEERAPDLDGFDRVTRIGWFDDNDQFKKVTLQVERAGERAPADPATVSRLIALTISRVLHEEPDTLVYLRIRALKTVPLAVGWYLADSRRIGDEACQREKCRVCSSAWGRLRPLSYNPGLPQDQNRQLQLLRIHHAMPPLSELTEDWPLKPF